MKKDFKDSKIISKLKMIQSGRVMIIPSVDFLFQDTMNNLLIHNFCLFRSLCFKIKQVFFFFSIIFFFPSFKFCA